MSQTPGFDSLSGVEQQKIDIRLLQEEGFKQVQDMPHNQLLPIQ